MLQRLPLPRAAGSISRRLTIISLLLTLMSMLMEVNATTADISQRDTVTYSFYINFPINSAAVDAKYATNAAALDSLAMLLDEATSRFG